MALHWKTYQTGLHAYLIWSRSTWTTQTKARKCWQFFRTFTEALASERDLIDFSPQTGQTRICLFLSPPLFSHTLQSASESSGLWNWLPHYRRSTCIVRVKQEFAAIPLAGPPPGTQWCRTAWAGAPNPNCDRTNTVETRRRHPEQINLPLICQLGIWGH